MTPSAIIYSSRKGNNALLARHLAAATGGRTLTVVERRWRFGIFTLIRDMSLKRRPKIRTLELAPEIGRVLFIGPIFDMQVAHALASAVLQLRDRIPRYAFATLCGYRREGQEAHIREELADLAGHPPEHVWQLFVSDLVPEAKRQSPWVVSRYRVREAELRHYDTEIAAIAGWCRGDGPERGG